MSRTQVETEIWREFRAGRDWGLSYMIAETMEVDHGVGAVQSEGGAGQTLAKYVPQLNENNEQTWAGIVCSVFGSKTTS